MEVFFDDLRVKQLYSNIVSGNDYYPFGLEIEDRRITREDYRFGYQGQFAEKDEETGWNHFELREYDAVIGRWTTKDPFGQYYSPYVGMGNNPVSEVDPSGGSSSSPIFGKDGKFLGVDSEGYTGQVITMDEALYNQLTNNGETILQHDFVIALADNGIFANYLPNANLSLEGYASIYNNVLNQMPDVDFSRLFNGSVSIYNNRVDENGVPQGFNFPEATGRYEVDPALMKISINEVYNSELTSVEVIQNYLGIHEMKGHNLLRILTNEGHSKVWRMQKEHHTFNKLPLHLQCEIIKESAPAYK